jgi:hypothetical protein
VTQPKAISLKQELNALVFEYSRRGPKAISMVLFTLFWNGFMVVWFTIALSEGQTAMALFGVFHAGVGLWLAYSTAVLLFNKTSLRIDSSQLSVRDGPLPYGKPRCLNTAELTQCYVKAPRPIRRKNQTVNTGYDLVARLNDGSTQVLIENLPELDQARYLEQEIEKTLGLSDRHVSGEAL